MAVYFKFWEVQRMSLKSHFIIQVGISDVIYDWIATFGTPDVMFHLNHMRNNLDSYCQLQQLRILSQNFTQFIVTYLQIFLRGLWICCWSYKKWVLESDLSPKSPTSESLSYIQIKTILIMKKIGKCLTFDSRRTKNH